MTEIEKIRLRSERWQRAFAYAAGFEHGRGETRLGLAHEFAEWFRDSDEFLENEYAHAFANFVTTRFVKG